MFIVHNDPQELYNVYNDSSCSDSVIVYGAGRLGRQQIANLQKIGISVECAFDENLGLHGLRINEPVEHLGGITAKNVPIKRPEIHAGRPYRIVIGIYEKSTQEEVISFLKKLYAKSESTYSCDIYLDVPVDLFFKPIYEQYREKLEKLPIKTYSDNQDATQVSTYWSDHLVSTQSFFTTEESLAQLHWRFFIYPMFREFYGGDLIHDGETFLDYGCGPGNDATWFSIHNKLNKLIAMDISYPALVYTQYRLALHDVAPEIVQLVHISDETPLIPLPDSSVDFINCQGVLMHTSNPEEILKEFSRVLRPNGKACFMVYNKASVYYHFYVAYYLRFISEDARFAAIEDTDERFTHATDGFNCPMSRCYTPDDFLLMCHDAFKNLPCKYLGAYPSHEDLLLNPCTLQQALNEPQLDERHKHFLRQITFDKNNFPLYNGKYAGVGGIFWVNNANYDPFIF